MYNLFYTENIMNLKKHVFIFNTIAGIYDWFFPGQYAKYFKIISENIHTLNIEKGARILDIGCGTGAFTKAWLDNGYEASGVDISANMVSLGLKKSLDCRQGNAIDGLPYPDKSFDLVVLSYVAHGLDRSKREKLYLEASRLAVSKVLIHDYGTRRSIGTDLIEFLEGGDYFNFIKSGIEEMKSVFKSVSVHPVDGNASWYLCTPGE